MGQWAKTGQFRMFIFNCVLKGLGCGFRSELDKGDPSEQNLYTIRSEAPCASKGGCISPYRACASGTVGKDAWTFDAAGGDDTKSDVTATPRRRRGGVGATRLIEKYRRNYLNRFGGLGGFLYAACTRKAMNAVSGNWVYRCTFR
jgi:hypothetical protein